MFTDGPSPCEYIMHDRAHGQTYSRVLAHINDWFPGRVRTIIDGGAHTGVYSEAYALMEPEATIYAFEPILVAYERLLKMSKRLTNIKPYFMALSDRTGHAKMHMGHSVTGAKIVSDGEIQCNCVSGRDFCAQKEIERVNFLKLDVEGHELKVLDGFDLEKVDFIQVEAGVNRHETQMLSYQELYEYLVERKFWVFGFYDQLFEAFDGAFEGEVNFSQTGFDCQYQNGAPIVRKMDAVFINNDLVKLRNA
jgi:FkbM family methyltransferase